MPLTPPMPLLTLARRFGAFLLIVVMAGGLLRPAGAAEPPMRFELLDVQGQRLPWTSAGPQAGTPAEATVLGGGFVSRQRVNAMALRGDGQERYLLTGNGGTLSWQGPPGSEADRQDLPLPEHLPRLSWARSLAWDEARGLLAVASTGTDAQFYRLDTRSRRWLDARPLRLRDVASLAFNAATGGFAAVTGTADLLLLDAQGEREELRPLAGVLPALDEARHPQTHSFEGLQVFAQGDRFALVNVRDGRVTHVWTYERASRQAALSYKPGGVPAALPPAASGAAGPAVAPSGGGLALRQLVAAPATWPDAVSPATEARLQLAALVSGAAGLAVLAWAQWRRPRGRARVVAALAGLALAALPVLMLLAGRTPGSPLLLGPLQILQVLQLAWMSMRLGVPLAEVLGPQGYSLAVSTSGAALLLLAMALMLRPARQRVTALLGVAVAVLLAVLPARELAARRASAALVARESAAGEALFAARCERAGVRRPYPVGGVDGVRLEGLRGPAGPGAAADPDWPEAGIPGDAVGEAYVRSFLDVDVDDARDHPGWSVGFGISRVTIKGYDFVDVRQPQGHYLRHRLARDGRLETQAIEPAEAARYAVSYGPSGEPADRRHWVAGALVRVTDTRSGQVLGELEAYAWQPPARRGGGDLSRRQWLGARTCPAYADQPGMRVRLFTEHVLQRPRD